MSLTLAEEDLEVQHQRVAPRQGRLAAGAGLVAAVLFLLLCLASFVVGAGARSATGSEVGQIAADFSLRSVADERISLKEFRGRPVLLLIGDKPLPAEAVNGIDAVDDRIAVIHVHKSETSARDAVARPGTRPIVHLLDPHGIMEADYAPERLPAALLIAPGGRIVDSGPPAEIVRRVAESG
jgi:hypothetical protein